MFEGNSPKTVNCNCISNLSFSSCVVPYLIVFLSRYRLQTVRSLAGVSLMLRLLWACLRWDDMAVKPLALVAMTRKGKETGSNWHWKYSSK